MPPLRFFTFIEYENDTYRVPVFETDDGATFEYPLQRSVVKAFTERGTEITLNGVPIDPQSQVGKELIGASLSISALDGLLAESGETVASLDAAVYNWRSTLDSFTHAIDVWINNENKEVVTDTAFATAGLAIGVTFALAFSGGALAPAIVPIAASAAATGFRVRTAVEERLAAGAEAVAAETTIAGLKGLLVDGQESVDRLYNSIDEAFGNGIPKGELASYFSGREISIDHLKFIYERTVESLAHINTAQFVSRDIAQALDIPASLIDQQTTSNEIFNVLNEGNGTTSGLFLNILGLLPGTKYVEPGIAFTTYQSIVDRLDAIKSVGNVVDADIEAIQEDLVDGFADSIHDFSETLNTFFNFFEDTKLDRIQNLLSDIDAPGAEDAGGSATDPVALSDSDNDDVISTAGTINDASDRDYFEVSLEPFSVYTLIAGPDSSSSVTPEVVVRDADTQRIVETTTTSMGNSIRVGFDTQVPRDVIIEVAADTATTYEFFLRRQDGAEPDKWDPAFDDFRNSITDDRLPLGEVRFESNSDVVSGTLNHRADPDFFEIPGDAGWAYDITMVSSDDNAVTFDLLDSDGRRLVDAVGTRTDRIRDVIAEEDGPLYLRVTDDRFGSGDEVSDYEILVERSRSSRLDDTVGETRASATSLALGDTVAGEIDYDDDHDMFRVDLGSSSQVKTFEFQLEALDQSEPVSFRLYDAQGDDIREDDTTWFDMPLGAGEQGVYIKGDPGTVYVDVTADTGGSDYSLQITERSGGDIPADASTTARVSYVTQEGQGTVSANAQIETAGDVDWFKVDVDAKPSSGLWSYYLNDQGIQVYEEFVTSERFDYDTYPVGLSTEDDSFTAVEDGTHYFAIYHDDELGPYVPEVVRYDDDHANHIAAATQLTFEAHGIARGNGYHDVDDDTDLFAFDVAKGQGVAVELQELDGNDKNNLDFEILTADGTELMDSDRSERSDDIQVLDDGILVSDSDQTLYINVQGGFSWQHNLTRAYDIRVSDVAATDLDDDSIAAASRLPRHDAQDDDVLTRVLNGPKDVDFIRLQLDLGTIYSFNTDDNPSDFEDRPVVQLYNDGGQRIFGADDDVEGRSGLDYRVDHYQTDSSAEEVFLAVRSAPYTKKSDDVGPYTIEIDADPIDGSRSPGDSWSENLSGRGERAYTLDIPEGYAVIASIDNFSAPPPGEDTGTKARERCSSTTSGRGKHRVTAASKLTGGKTRRVVMIFTFPRSSRLIGLARLLVLEIMAVGSWKICPNHWPLAIKSTASFTPVSGIVETT
jgi:hypothetical protein